MVIPPGRDTRTLGILGEPDRFGDEVFRLLTKSTLRAPEGSSTPAGGTSLFSRAWIWVKLRLLAMTAALTTVVGMIAVPLSGVSWLRMDQALEKVKNRLLRVARALRDAGLSYAVVGGNAVASWVSRVDEAAVRNTRDVDILLRRSDFEKVVEALEGAGFVHRQVASLGRKGAMDVFLESENAKVRDAVHVLWASEKVLPDSIEPSPDVTEAEDVGEFRLIRLDALVRMKLASFRDKDRMHLRDLLSVGLVDETTLRGLPGPMRERLRVILDDPEG